jgi:hypothetical protein
LWLLLIIFTHLDWGTQVLETFDTQQACLIERDRVGLEMAASYPEEQVEHTFDIVCQLATRKI